MRLLVLLLALVPAAAAANPTAACHCFKDRTFDAARPAAADPYVLATTRSSLLSAAFGIPKATIVRTVMTGTQAADLWIAHWAAARSGGDAGALLDARQRRGGWAAVLAELPPARLGPELIALVAEGADAQRLAALAVEDVLVTRTGADPARLAAARAAGASTEEVVLAAMLAPHLQATPAQVVAAARLVGATWGTVLRDARLAPADLDGLVRARVR